MLDWFLKWSYLSKKKKKKKNPRILLRKTPEDAKFVLKNNLFSWQIRKTVSNKKNCQTCFWSEKDYSRDSSRDTFIFFSHGIMIRILKTGIWVVACLIDKVVILQVLDRGEKIELLVDKTENLRSQVSDCKYISPPPHPN